MSTKLYWKPVPKKEPPVGVAYLPLKAIIAQRYLDHDGSLCSREGECTLTKRDIPYIQGLVDGGCSVEAKLLLEALIKHGELYIWTAE